MALINVVDLTFAYEGSYDNIFESVSFQIDTDWKLGFIGRNGRGKTTFLKLLLGKYEYSGTIAAAGLEFEYFPYEVKDMRELTLDVIKRICPQAEDWEIMRELSMLQMEAEALYRPFDTLSEGQRTKALLCGLFLKENTFLLIDEPTNHLDMEGRDILAQYLRKKRSFILVSHDRMFLDNCIDHVLSINRSDIEIQKGNFSSWWENRRLQDEHELAEHAKLKKDIRRLEGAARRAAGWSEQVEKSKKGTRIAGLRPDRGFIGHKSAKMMKKAKTLEKRRQGQLEDKSKLLKNLEEKEELKIHPLKFQTEKLVELEGISIFYGDTQAVKEMNLTICQGERLALRGKNGCGKSSVLRLICGERISEKAKDGHQVEGGNYTGAMRKNPALKISYVSQDTSGLRGNLKDYAVNSGIDETLFKAILRKLDFSREQFDKDMEYFSAGQKKKVMIAASLCQPAHLYIWDEPLNYIDVISRMQIEELLTEYKPTLLFVEHDRAFCERVATGTVWMQ
ncbi:ABC-F type ribosomal protection protein [Bariatricus massiliensis]|uniref:ABC-F type ribosomal protection protein n=1 Tax=Bariatricus massiliensis TaxID=1745713 RepID=A0ABS8DE77_9FIRM|nr:ABC-F type ribosomal protection protein [Bariatricus massiliensis]MCB7302830.1 ABC-F type ribosomal protection protein [Bariatricus massiliensis]MCB7374046.1 ABC-F type ribosomal protection protein [Bariatricus massiliensis]MCB7386716.1 ABC-F type ribosomal protection protein [Bariatricus massiliensis]MCB7410878.1 ABC-F type ribosomal protection protein [Bariatricus massiliensis]MCQ5251702.1 ABC-F type ribosomal protection protein [Bariatricus massiliensis]